MQRLKKIAFAALVATALAWSWGYSNSIVDAPSQGEVAKKGSFDITGDPSQWG